MSKPYKKHCSTSKKICELCGIKPRVIQDYELNDIELYPNFLEPENFFKLMKIKISQGFYQGMTFLHYANCRPNRICETFNDYLKILIDALKGQGRMNLTEVQSVINKIKRSKWKYEGDINAKII